MTGWLAAARVYLEPRVLLVMALGFSSGLPYLLTASTLSIWLKEEGVSIEAIGFFALVAVPYTYKFLWAPLIDQVRVPFLTRAIGRRRSWALLTQVLLIGCIVGLGSTNPSAELWLTAVWAVAVAFFSASQDIVVDAVRVELLDDEQQAAGAAVAVAGYRVGVLVAGAGALVLAETMPWSLVYAVMAGMVAVGVVAILLCPEPRRERAKVTKGAAAWLKESVVAPLLDFMRRPAWVAILCFVVLYKLGDALAGALANPFYIAMGFSKSEIAGISKVFGFWATLAGGFIGGLMVVRLGLMRSLLVCGVLQMLSNLLFAIQAALGNNLAFLTLLIAGENITGGMGTAAFVAYLSGLCNVAYTATQYALLSALATFARTTLASFTGVLVAQVGWIWFFGITTVAALPGLLLLLWLGARGFRPQEGRR